LSPRLGGATFPLSHRLRRFAWNVVWMGLGYWTPPPLHAWRRLLLRAFGAKITAKSYIYGGVHIWYPPNLEMADYACLAAGVDCYCMDKISLGERALVSQRAFLCAGTHEIADPEFPLVTKPIHIGAEAWVAADAFVGPGVVVGKGAILGARGVAFRDLEPWTVYVGNPAKPLKRRIIRQ
jgi:putative colanic acid biosynthesis acetyltransferase WcaF